MDIVEEVGGHRLNVKDFLVLREGDSVELVTLSHPDVIVSWRGLAGSNDAERVRLCLSH